VFEFVDRTSDRSLVLISGWAFDCRIYSALDLPYNYLLFEAGGVKRFERELKEELAQRRIKRVSLFGWSQGAFVAADFAAKNPELVDELILVGARRQYEKDAVEKIKRYLKKNAHLFMSKFYKECFSKYEQDCCRRFSDSLGADYLQEIPAEKLMAQLDWLTNKRIMPDSLADVRRVTLAHGDADAIAPVAEAVQIAGQIPGAHLVVFEEAGHIPFLRNDFSKRLYEQ